MNLATLTAELAAALDTVPGLTVVPFPDASMEVPAACIGWPEGIDYTAAGKGTITLNPRVVLMVGGADPRAAFAALMGFASSTSVPAAIEAGTYSQGVGVAVTRVDFDMYSWGGIDYPAAIFLIDAMGLGG